MPVLRLWPLFSALICAAVTMAASGLVYSDESAESPSATDASTTEDLLPPDARNYWAFQPVVRPPIPRVKSAHRVRTPIDALLLAELESRGLSFAPPAGKDELLRRVYFDLIGLPPTPAERAAFLADAAPDAYTRLVDRLLADPRYGERRGRMWLDLVRFAETAGFNADPPRPLAYKYRDYVIRSFNQDKPYDRFVQEQIAGDELFPDDVDALVATGYLRMWPDESNASDVLLARQDALNDLTANVGAVFLGLSLGCAQCHDHKFDPLLQDDFYRLQAFFAGIVLEDRVPVAPADQIARYRRELDRWLAETASVRHELHALEHGARKRASVVKRKKFPPIVLEAIDTPAEERTAFQRQLAFWSERQIEVDEKQLLAQLDEKQKQRLLELRKRLEELSRSKPSPPGAQAVMATVEVQAEPPPTFLLAGGSYQVPLDEMAPGFPTVLQPPGSPSVSIQPPWPGTSGRRTALARWLTDPGNPLTVRVIVNRIWQVHFGRGLVQNANDFGTQTPPPSHPQLLDYLAARFIADGWSIKALDRQIVLSEAYRQSSRTDHSTTERALMVDAANRYYWRYPRRRLDAESVRDCMLFVADRLNDTMFGPGIKPELPAGYSSRHAWKPEPRIADRNRRSVYIYAQRNLRYPLLEVFDFPDMHESCARRAETTVAPQALTLLNSPMILALAEDFADRLLRQTPLNDTAGLVREAYRIAFSRDADDDEIEAGLLFLKEQARLLAAESGSPAAGRSTAEDGAASDRTAGENAAAKADIPDDIQKAALVDFCHVLLNANEFVYID